MDASLWEMREECLEVWLGSMLILTSSLPVCKSADAESWRIAMCKAFRVVQLRVRHQSKAAGQQGGCLSSV